MFGNGTDVVRAEKERTMLRYRRLRRAASLSRCLLELLAVLSLLSWSSARLPAAITLCSGLRHLPSLLLHPLSAFLLGNVIIVTLVAKSSEARAATPSPSLSSTAMPASSGAHDVHRHRYVSAASPAQQHSHQVVEAGVPQVVLEDKEVCTQSIAVAATATSPKKGRPVGPRFQRMKSADVVAAVAKMDPEKKLLRRSQSEAGVGAGEKAVANWWKEREEEDADDSEEFRQKIEAFIARQMRFIEREESLLLAGALRVAAATQEHDRR